jgi:hypothetical protein
MTPKTRRASACWTRSFNKVQPMDDATACLLSTLDSDNFIELDNDNDDELEDGND